MNAIRPNFQGVLITQEPNKLFDECHKIKSPGIIVWNLIRLAYEVFKQKYGFHVFDIFDCPTGVSLLLFSQLCVFHQKKVSIIQSDSISISTIWQEQRPKEAQQFSTTEEGFLGKAWTGNANQPICVSGNSALTILGRTSKTSTYWVAFIAL